MGLLKTLVVGYLMQHSPQPFDAISNPRVGISRVAGVSPLDGTVVKARGLHFFRRPGHHRHFGLPWAPGPTRVTVVRGDDSLVVEAPADAKGPLFVLWRAGQDGLMLHWESSNTSIDVEFDPLVAREW